MRATPVPPAPDVAVQSGSHATTSITPWLLNLLACPRHGLTLGNEGQALICSAGDSFPVVDGIPVLLLSDVRQTHPAAGRSIEEAAAGIAADDPRDDGRVDPFVQGELLATNGHMYRSIVGSLTTYPIPRLRVQPRFANEVLLDVGCNWGRWSVAAARAGFHPVGIDPSFRAVRAARRVARQLGVAAEFLVADARYLPFRPGAFDAVFSYSVWQHFDKQDTQMAAVEAARVLKPGGCATIQMANAFGVRSLCHQARRGFRPARDFEVRYWRPSELRRMFGESFGSINFTADGFFSLNAQTTDLEMLPRRFQSIVRLSDSLRSVSVRIPWLVGLADSLSVTAIKSHGRAGVAA